MIRLRQELLASVLRPLPQACRLPQGYVLEVTTERLFCEDCGVKLRVQWTSLRRPLGISLEEPLLRHRIKRCPRCRRIYQYEDIDMLVPPAANHAYDVIAEVGLGRFLHYRQNEQIVSLFARKHERNLPLGDIHHLTHAFLDGLAVVHEESHELRYSPLRRR